MENILAQVRDFADKAHGDQMRKYTPERYIVHPLRVMETCRRYYPDLAILSAALLHDVLEDTSLNQNDLREFLLTLMDETQTSKTIKLVEELTDIYIKADYPHWNRKKRKQKEAERLSAVSPEAQTIKYADIIDNSVEISQFDPEFAPTYLREAKLLLKYMIKGDERLRQLAIEAVEAEIRKLG